MKTQECESKMEQVKSENEVAERETTIKVWSFRVESAKWQQFLSCDCFVLQLVTRDRAHLSKSVAVNFAQLAAQALFVVKKRSR